MPAAFAAVEYATQPPRHLSPTPPPDMRRPDPEQLINARLPPFSR